MCNFIPQTQTARFKRTCCIKVNYYIQKFKKKNNIQKVFKLPDFKIILKRKTKMQVYFLKVFALTCKGRVFK